MWLIISVNKGGNTMPVITIDLWTVSPETKAELIGRLTTTASEITGLPPSAFFVYVREYPSDSIGVGGTPLSQLKDRNG
jgi:4-oxalocrotonate tautomerase